MGKEVLLVSTGLIEFCVPEIVFDPSDEFNPRRFLHLAIYPVRKVFVLKSSDLCFW